MDARYRWFVKNFPTKFRKEIHIFANLLKLNSFQSTIRRRAFRECWFCWKELMSTFLNPSSLTMTPDSLWLRRRGGRPPWPPRRAPGGRVRETHPTASARDPTQQLAQSIRVIRHPRRQEISVDSAPLMATPQILVLFLDRYKSRFPPWPESWLGGLSGPASMYFLPAIFWLLLPA